MRKPRIEVYRAESGWWWRFKAANGRILADSGQGYSRRIDAFNALGVVCCGRVNLTFTARTDQGTYAQGWLRRSRLTAGLDVFVEVLP